MLTHIKFSHIILSRKKRTKITLCESQQIAEKFTLNIFMTTCETTKLNKE